MGHSFRSMWGTFASALVAAVVACQLLIGAVTHDPIDHGDEPVDTCAICAFGQVHEPPPALPCDLAAPVTARTPAPAARAEPAARVVPVDHPARGPPRV
ncbi:MAG: hypothetical protein ACODAG_03465 [Myxococcota bacterium]